MKFKILFVFLITSLGSCLKGDIRLKIVNKIDKDFYYIWSEDTLIGPDAISASDTLTIKSRKNNIYLSPNWRKIYKDSTKIIMQICCWEDAFNLDKDHTQHLFIFFEETIEKLPWDTISKYNLYDKRLDFTLEDIEKLNWEIVIN